ncbi:MAG: molecular chaperone HtpG [Clostridia bacterium]|nr:molecular chaperone HtpG [Clostridia bacterium]
MKNFKTESKRILDLMINSIYTNKEIFLRELISNGSDAIDKLYYKSLSENIGLNRGDFEIKISADKENRILTISDNGIGMTAEELENNLGTIAKSGSLAFKNDNAKKEDIDIIGQFGVGFYSVFMIGEKVEVLSKAYGSTEANMWVSAGAEGYEVKPAKKETNGTEIRIYIKADTEDERYTEYLEYYKLRELIKRYSDYIRYPIKIENEVPAPDDSVDGEGKKIKTIKEWETINSMIPMWRKSKADLSDEDYNKFYKDMFYDFQDPFMHMHYQVEGLIDYKALIYIPKKCPEAYFSKYFERGLKLYSNGVLIMDKCRDLIPEYFGFIQGLVDCELSLNISRETVQQDRGLRKIASNIEKQIRKELQDMLENDRPRYEEFYNNFGLQLKVGIYNNWGMDKDKLQDLVMFYSAKQDKLITFKDYVAAMPEGQKYIYYATGSSLLSVKKMPQTEKILNSGYDVLCMTDNVDEFAIKYVAQYDGKEFKNVTDGNTGIESATEETLEEDKPVLEFIKTALEGEVFDVKLSKKLGTHPVCLSTEGEVSLEMEKVFKAMPKTDGAQDVRAKKILEINAEHKIYQKVKSLFETDKDAAKDIALVLLDEAKLIEGIEIEDMERFVSLVSKYIAE